MGGWEGYVRESANKYDSTEAIQSKATSDEIRHAHVPRSEAAGMQGGCHLAVSIGALLTNDCDFRP